MSRPDCVEFTCDSINEIDAISGGQYGRQLRVTVQMTEHQVNAAICELLGHLPKPNAHALLRGKLPELFEVAA